MDYEMIMNQMEQDFEELAKEHEVTASNERLWSKGADDSETAAMHEANAEQHIAIAKMYRNMKRDTLAFVETYEDYLD